MPQIQFKGQVIHCEAGEVLRDVLLREGISPHNGQARWFNCKGLGSCGTCAVAIEGELGPKSLMERWRLDFPPHDSSSGLRLACQIRVQGDLVVHKHPGFWGHEVEQGTASEP